MLEESLLGYYLQCYHENLKGLICTEDGHIILVALSLKSGDINGTSGEEMQLSNTERILTFINISLLHKDLY